MNIPATIEQDSAANEVLAARCERMAEVASESIEWIGMASELVRGEGAAMARAFRRDALRSRKLAAAARRPMCVSVFGPSQQGKSYLVASLARRGDALAMIRFGDEVRDFVGDINPDGGKESTGLVTRFTIRPVAGLPGMPVACRMLSETDIIKIMANAFMEDFDRDTVTAMEPTEIEAIMARMRAKAARDPVDRLTEDDVYDLFEYFERYFRNHPSHVALKPAHWREIETLAPRLSIPDRTELFAMLWNATPTMTRVAIKLISALARLDFPDEAFCPLQAVEPKRTSVIDVETMATLGVDGGDTVPVATRAGRRAELERAVLTAVIAELQLQLADKPFEFFEHTDLLDFPGARTRGKEPAQNAEREAQNNIFLLFRRGKVAYLYQRYLAEQELTSMLLCLKHSNQEVATVPFMVNDWISGTHGDTPEGRRGGETALFLIYTMFDVEFGSKAGQRDDAVERWSTRIETTLYQYLGKSHDWPHNWTPGQPFANTFWLRNPAVRDEGLLDYDGKRERDFRNRERIDMLRSTFLSNPDVCKHFADPATAWDAAMALNDGGIAYIASKLGPVCNPELKRRQVEAQARELAHQMAGRLEPHHVSGDLDAELTKRRAEARAVGRQLLACAEAQAFGLLLRELQVRADVLSELFRRQQLAASETPSLVNAPVGTRATRKALQDDFDAMFDDPADAPVEVEAEGPSGPRDLADLFAETAVTEWLAGMHRWSERADVPDLFRISSDGAAMLVAQLAAGARRIGLRDMIANRMRQGAAYHEGLADRLLKPVMIAERCINDFVTWLGFDAVPPGERPKAGREQRIVFTRAAAAEDTPSLSETPLAYDAAFYVDWAIAFVRLVEDNVRSSGGITVDIAANARLGGLLRSLQSISA